MISLIATLLLAQTPQLPHEFEADRKPSYTTGGNVLLRHARVMTVTHGTFEDTDILVQGGKLAAIGKNLNSPAGIKTVDLTGKSVTPGLVDAHSHRGIDDVNEIAAISSEVRISDVINGDQIGIYNALASGITTGLALHGSANPIGGQSTVLRNKYRGKREDMMFPGAPRMIKFALGENVKDWGGARFPNTRMGVEAVYRRAFNDAKDYISAWDAYRADGKTAPPRRDLRLEALADILRGKIRVQCHSYRQDEMLMMVRLSQEFGFSLVLQHALESYKIAPELAKAKIPVSMFADGFAYKLEVIDSMPMAATILDQAGVLVSINTDTSNGTVPLAQDAAKTIRYGTSPDHALRMITLNPAMQLGIADRVGSLDIGKDADLAVWNGNPLSTYAKCVAIFIEGEPYFERKDAFGVDKSSLAGAVAVQKVFAPASVTTPKASAAYLITGATVHPVSGPVLPNTNVLIVNGRIQAVGPKFESSSVPTRIDGRGLHLYPGFIDMATELGHIEFGDVVRATDAIDLGDFTPDLKANSAINPENLQFGKVRFNGVTTAVVWPSTGLIGGQAGIIRTVGSTTEDMQINNEFALSIVAPEGPTVSERANLPSDERDKRLEATTLRRQVIVDYLEGAKRYLAARDAGAKILTDSKLESLRPFLEGRRPVIFSAEGQSAILWALEMTKKFKLKPILLGASDGWKLIKEIKAADVPVVIEPPAGQCPSEDPLAAEFDPYDSPMVRAALMRRAGIRIAFASEDWGTAMNLPYRVGRACAFGLSHDDAIRALTLDAAKTLGMGDQLGSIEPGKIANIILTDGDPLEVTTSLRYLFIDGKPVPLESHYTRLYQKYRARFK